jgi:type IV pilus assembly protein PilF
MRFSRILSSLCPALLALAAVTGCVSSEPKPTRESEQEAALVNAQLAVTYLQQNNLQAAQEKIEKALKQDPKTARTQMAAGFVYDRLGEDQKAGSHFAEALRYEPKNPDVLNNYAVFLCRKGDRRQGEQYFIAAAASPLYRTPEAAYTNAGRCALADGRPKDAEGYFRKALTYRRDLADPLLPLAQIYLEDGNYLQARAFVQRYMSVTQPNAASLWLAYRIEAAAGNPQQAEVYARRLKTEFATSEETRQLIESERGGS